MTYDKLHACEVYDLLSFDICIHLGNHHHSGDSEHTQCPQIPHVPVPFVTPLFRPPPSPRQPLNCFLSSRISLPFLMVIKMDSRARTPLHLFSFTPHNYCEIHPPRCMDQEPLLFTAQYQSTVWRDHNWSTRPPVDGHWVVCSLGRL